ncbi:unnamed protein product [Prunus armeniaca]
MLVGRSSFLVIFVAGAKDWKRQEKRLEPLTRKDNDILQGFSYGTNLPELPITSQFRKYGPKMDTKKIVVITQIHKVHPNLWKPRSGLELMNNDLPSTNPEEAMSCFDLSKNDSSLISATGGMISIFYMTTFKTMKKVMPPPPVATCLAFHPRDDSIVGIGMDNSTIVIYNLHSDEVTRNLEGHAKRVTSLSLRPLTSNEELFKEMHHMCMGSIQQGS